MGGESFGGNVDKHNLYQEDYRLADWAMPNSSPPKLKDSLWVENPLAGMLKVLSIRNPQSAIRTPTSHSPLGDLGDLAV
jgi:hypothetical protein